MRLWQVDGEPSEEILAAVATILKARGVVLMPTDTIYGLHGLAGNPAINERIARIKGRPEDKPFVIIAANLVQLGKLDLLIPEVLESLWPAPLTAILPRTSSTPLAVRVPDSRWLRDLLELTGPLVSTSANPSGELPITSPSQLPDNLQSALDAIVDGGVREAKASAIVDFTGAQPRLIREGDPGFTQKLRKTLRKSL
ncbi:MAG: L-threonylcarbamoyladenylate synthase [Thermoanaerobaculia bacterium]